MKRILSLILVLALSLALPLALTSCESEEMGTGYCEYLETRDIEGRDITYVEMCVEDYGKLVILLDATSAPKTVANFVKLVNEGFYDGLTFHRVKSSFMIQGGDPKADGSGGSDKTIKGEFIEGGYRYNDIDHIEGVISMARGNDPHSASSQFFICNSSSTNVTELDGKYAAFGYVVEGLSVVKAITSKTASLGDSKNMNVIANKDEQPVIKYIKVLEDYTPPVIEK